MIELFCINTFIVTSEFVSFLLSPAGLVPYIITPRHFQEGIASSSHLYHVRACFLFCHRLSCAALYGPISIPSILYLAYLQLESHGFYSFDYNNIWEGQRWFSCVHIWQSQDSWLDFSRLPSKSSWPPALLGIGRECLQKMVLNIHHRGGLNPSVQKLSDLSNKDKEKWWIMSSLTRGHGWILPTLQTLRTAITKRLDKVVETKQDLTS